MTFDELQTLTEKNTRAIGDLIVAARLTLDAAKTLESSFDGGMKSLKTLLEGYAKAAEERSKELDERMNALIHTVDDLVRDRWRRKNGEDDNR